MAGEKITYGPWTCIHCGAECMAIGERKCALTEERVICPNPDCTFIHHLSGCPISIEGLYCRSEEGRWQSVWAEPLAA